MMFVTAGLYRHRTPSSMSTCLKVGAVKMRPLTMSSSESSKTCSRRHICAWCHRDLGALDHNSEFDSYGICPDCVSRHFTHLYMPESDMHDEPALAARTVGAPGLVVRELAL
jgi:hypothetical protein